MSLFQMLNDNSDENIIEFTKGIQCFESKKFQEAISIFSSLNDKTSKYLENVVKNYKYYSFDDDWSGEIKIDKDGNLVDLDNGLVFDKEIDLMSMEEELDILKDLKGEELRDVLKAWSKEYPEKVASIIKMKDRLSMKMEMQINDEIVV